MSRDADIEDPMALHALGASTLTLICGAWITLPLLSSDNDLIVITGALLALLAGLIALAPMVGVAATKARGRGE